MIKSIYQLEAVRGWPKLLLFIRKKNWNSPCIQRWFFNAYYRTLHFITYMVFLARKKYHHCWFSQFKENAGQCTVLCRIQTWKKGWSRPRLKPLSCLGTPRLDEMLQKRQNRILELGFSTDHTMNGEWTLIFSSRLPKF